MGSPDRVTLVRAGDRRAMASLMRDIDDRRAHVTDDLRALGVPAAAGAALVGITGAPGTGKSTLVDAVVSEWRARGQRVGVVTVDPTSPLAGGAILGDRVRMQRHATDAGVFIRSVASRGASGGLSRSALDIAAVLVAGGFSRVLLETVGVGQGEVDIAAAADITVLVTVPGLGDDVQAMKAGILEIADILVVNKFDTPGAERTAHELRAMLALRHASASGRGRVGDDPVWATAPADIPIIETVATTGKGAAALVDAIERLGPGGSGSGSGDDRYPRLLRRARARIRDIVAARTDGQIEAALRAGGLGSDLAHEVAAARVDPEAAADALMARLRGGY